MKKIKIKSILFLLILMNAIFLTATAIRLYWFATPCRLETDCRKYNIDTEWIKQWEEQEKTTGEGILTITGWQTRENTEILAVSTGRKTQAQPLGVYGSIEQVFPTKILSGTYGPPDHKDICILSQDLADELFGNIDIVGEKIKIDHIFRNKVGKNKQYNKETLSIVGVIEKEGNYLLIPMEEGTIEKIAVVFERRFQAKKRLEQVFEGR